MNAFLPRANTPGSSSSCSRRHRQFATTRGVRRVSIQRTSVAATKCNVPRIGQVRMIVLSAMACSTASSSRFACAARLPKASRGSLEPGPHRAISPRHLVSRDQSLQYAGCRVGVERYLGVSSMSGEQRSRGPIEAGGNGRGLARFGLGQDSLNVFRPFHGYAFLQCLDGRLQFANLKDGLQFP